MDPANLELEHQIEQPRFLHFPHLPHGSLRDDGQPALNKYSSTITRGHDFSGAQVRRSARDSQPPNC